MAVRLIAALMLLVLPLTASMALAQPEMRRGPPPPFRAFRERALPVMPRLAPRLPRRGPLDMPFAPLAPRAGAFLSPQDVTAILAARSLSLVGELRRRGNYYVMDARGPGGEVVKLVVNGASGQVEGVQVRGPR